MKQTGRLMMFVAILGSSAFAEHDQGDKRAAREKLEASERSRLEFGAYCPKKSGLYCAAFSRPNDDRHENYAAFGTYETARFIVSLKTDPEKPRELALAFEILPTRNAYSQVGEYGLQDFKNPLPGPRARPMAFMETEEETKSKTLNGRVWKAGFSLGELPKGDGKYEGEVLVRDLRHLERPDFFLVKHKLIWKIEVKDGKVNDVEIRFDQRAKELRQTYIGRETHDILLVASNIPGQSISLPYPPKLAVPWRPALVEPQEPKDIPKDLPSE